MNQQGTVVRSWQTPDWVIWLIALVGPAVLTAVLLGITGAENHRRRIRRLPGDTTSEVIRQLSGVDVHILRAEQVA